MLHDWLKTVVDLQTIHCIRLVSCFSAYGGGSSFVCRLSRLLPEAYIKGYVNEVFSQMSPQATGYGLGEFGPVQTAVQLQRLIPDGPPPLDKLDKKFCSVTYKNDILIKRTDSKSK